MKATKPKGEDSNGLYRQHESYFYEIQLFIFSFLFLKFKNKMARVKSTINIQTKEGK